MTFLINVIIYFFVIKIVIFQSIFKILQLCPSIIYFVIRNLLIFMLYLLIFILMIYISFSIIFLILLLLIIFILGRLCMISSVGSDLSLNHFLLRLKDRFELLLLALSTPSLLNRWIISHCPLPTLFQGQSTFP